MCSFFSLPRTQAISPCIQSTISTFYSDFTIMSSSPCSSPVSSPSLGPSDSSPPSSPNLDPILTTPPAFKSPSLTHPYAASTKANKRPKLYERHENGGSRHSERSPNTMSSDQERVRVPSHARAHSTESGSPLIHPFAGSAKSTWRPPRREAKYRRVDSTASASSDFFGGSDTGSLMSIEPLNLNAISREEDDFLALTDDESNDVFSPRYKINAVQNKKAREKELWDKAITKAIDDANGIVDLRYVHRASYRRIPNLLYQQPVWAFSGFFDIHTLIHCRFGRTSSTQTGTRRLYSPI